MTTFDLQDELLFRIHADVLTDGACVEYVDAGPGRPPWGYTVGLLGRAHPEVIVFGLDVSTTQDVLWGLIAEIEEGIVRPVGRTRRPRDLGCPPMPIRLVRVADEHWECTGDHLLCLAAGYHRALGRPREELRAVQLVWGTSRGAFPWHARSSQRDRRRQPLLDRVDQDRGRLP